MTYVHDDAAYQVAIARRIKENARKGRGARWLSEDPTRADLVAKLNEQYNMAHPDNFLLKMCDAYSDWGSLTPGQEKAVRVSFERKDEVKKARIEGQKGSQFVGKVGERSEFNLVFNVTFVNEGPYGTVYTNKFSDKDGNLVVWKSSNPQNFEKGQEVSLKASVKRHYTNTDGINITYITRAKII